MELQELKKRVSRIDASTLSCPEKLIRLEILYRIMDIESDSLRGFQDDHPTSDWEQEIRGNLVYEGSDSPEHLGFTGEQVKEFFTDKVK